MANSFPPPGINVHKISAKKARKLTAAFRARNLKIIPEAEFRHGFSFNKEIFEEILKQDDVVAIRIYFGIEEKPTDKNLKTAATEKIVPTLIVCGIDSNGSDMTNKIGENSWPCPPHCSTLATLIS